MQSGINQKIIAPFVQHTNDLAWKVMPTLEKIQDAADEAKSEWSKRIWKTAWTTSLFWSIFAVAILIACLICLEFAARYDHKMAVQIADMAQVMKFNQAAFQTLAVAQIPIQVLPTQNDGFDSPPGFVLVIEGAYAADMRQVNGQNNGCIFFRSSVPEKQIRHCSRTAKIRCKRPTTRQNNLPQHFPARCQNVVRKHSRFQERSRASQPRANPVSIVCRRSSRQGRIPLLPSASTLTRRPAPGLFRLGFRAWRSVR